MRTTRRKQVSEGEDYQLGLRSTHFKAATVDRRKIVKAILRMKLPAISWPRALEEVECGDGKASRKGMGKAVVKRPETTAPSKTRKQR